MTTSSTLQRYRRQRFTGLRPRRRQRTTFGGFSVSKTRLHQQTVIGLDMGHEGFETRHTSSIRVERAPRSSLSRLGSADPKASCSSHRAADEASHLHDVRPRTGALRLLAGY